MKAAFITSKLTIGQLANELQVDETTIPKPLPSDLKSDEVLINVKSASVDIDDLRIVEGSFLGGMPGLQSVLPTHAKPLVLGGHFSGVVVAVGSTAKKTVTVGQRVCGRNVQFSSVNDMGCWAEYTVSRPENLIVVPDDISFKEAAASVSPLTVIHGLLDKAKIQGDEKVMVLGASGGIGSMLIQILRKYYPTLDIVGVCSSKNEAFVKKLGANDIIDYTKGPIESSFGKTSKPCDIVFDLVGGKQSYSSSKKILKKGSKFITAVGPIEWLGDEMLSTWQKFMLVFTIIWNAAIMNCIPGSHPNYYMVAPKDLNDETFQRAFANRILPFVGKTFPFESAELKEAVEHIRSHRAKGKVMLDISST